LDYFLIESVFDLLIMDAHSIYLKCIYYFERYSFSSVCNKIRCTIFTDRITVFLKFKHVI
jgi:hypothetical protein